MSQHSSQSGMAPATARPPKVLPILEEARAAILAEQLAYLLDHADSCPADCPDCARMRAIEEILMRPFGVDVFPDAA